MADQQPEAILLAELCETTAKKPWVTPNQEGSRRIAAELRRLHAANVYTSDLCTQALEDVKLLRAQVERLQAAGQVVAPAMVPPIYRMLQPHVDQIEAADEFLQDDTVTWDTDPHGIFVGSIYGCALRPARRRINGLAVGGIQASGRVGK